MDGIFVWDADPVMIKISHSFHVGYYGVLFVTGLIIGYFIVQRIYKREGVPTNQLDIILLHIVAGTIIGARLGHCLFYEPGYFLYHPLEIVLPMQKMGGSWQFTGYRGLASHGGAFGVFVAIIRYCYKYKVKTLWLMDRLAIPIPIAGAFIRFGNFMNSEIYGKPTNGRWGVIFKRANAAPRHPTQLYEAFSYLAISGLLYYLYLHQKNRRDGFLFGLFIALLFAARFVIEYFKENQETFEDGMVLNMGQWLSIPFILGGLGYMAYGYLPKKNEIPSI
jgi:prolipoprotein diacylglyceryl transferase